MIYLIDTNILIFHISDPSILDRNTRKIFEDYENTIYISSESVKEYIHLLQSNRISPQKGVRRDDAIDFIENELGFVIKYVTKQHLAALAALPLVPKHNDPSDRLIISQAIAEKIPLISSDRRFEFYKKYKLNLVFNCK